MGSGASSCLHMTHGTPVPRPIAISVAHFVYARAGAPSSYSRGVSSKNVSSDGNDNGNSSGSKVSSVPPTPRSEGDILQSSNLKSFTYSDLRSATQNFRPDSVLGEGGFGSVFKGWIDEQSPAATKAGTGIVITVKRLNQESFQCHREWLAEVNYLGQLSHPNLVKLIGYPAFGL
ncbi:kinase APK1A, chloroplastic-like protein [Tanacetum coccineum]